MAHSTRESKRRDLGSEDLVALQRAQLSAGELAALERLIGSGPVARPRTSRSAAELVQMACEHLFERRSVVAEHEILEQALKFGRGTMDWKAVYQAMKAASDPSRTSSDIQKNGIVTTVPDVTLESNAIQGEKAWPLC